eukprot:TRINITY_DN27787_c0_g1_i2.p1 TRINITY_DN27787_c0_g1~~TRINITY_DN27787_c0_g1_i2.p1  ORF type:complete len:534 (+),score=89.95 TRINITY_DN27787_c0_g1_i2:384-1985(+)
MVKAPRWSCAPGWGDLGANGVGPSETPNLDRLASEGLRFTDFHAGASVCTPSRAALLTGRLGARTGVVRNFDPASIAGLDTAEKTIAEVVKSVGYDTKMIGKWHLGHHPEYHPSYRGFDHYVGLPYSNDMGCLDAVPTTGWDWVDGQAGHPPACAADSKNFAGNNALGDHALRGENGENSVPLYNSTKPKCMGQSSVGDCNADIVEQPVKLETLNSRYRAEAVKFIEEHGSDRGGQANPFFLYIGFAHMHVPHGFADEFKESSTSKTIYGDTLRELDHTIGFIVESIQRSGLMDSTFFVYTADNGPWNEKCSLAGSQGPFEGKWQLTQGGGGATGKFTTWEGGHREPAFFYWKDRISPGISTALASTLDLMPTIAALAGASLPADRSWDGLDLAPVLFEGRTTHHEHLFHPDREGNLNAMRLGELKAFYETYGIRGCNGKVPPDQWKKTHYPPLVFNLTADPAESSPIEVTDELLQRLDSVRNKTLEDIAATLRHEGHYERGDRRDWGCCNQQSEVCRCKGQSPYTEEAELVV